MMPGIVNSLNLPGACILLILILVVSSAQPDQQLQNNKLATYSPGQMRLSHSLGQTVPLQQQKSDERSESEMVIRENTDLVTFLVTVTDPYNRPVTGLDKQHFLVYEDKVRQKIDYFSSEDLPISIGVIFDVSGSMKGKINRAREALKAFIETSHHDDDFFLVGFNQRAQLMAEFSDGDSVANKLILINPRGQTALYDAVYLGVEKVKEGRHSKRALLVISDGQDNSSRYSWGELRKLVKESDVQIYCIGVVELGWGSEMTDLYGQAILEEIARVTGGKAFFPRTAIELEDIMTRIALVLRHQYSLGYIPTNERRNNKWRKIKVRLKPPRGLPHLTVRAKEGYYAAP
jgi:Ca-activated chloride channel family protein